MCIIYAADCDVAARAPLSEEVLLEYVQHWSIVKPWAKQQAVDDLRWLQMDWDTDAGFQLDDLAPYEQAMGILRNKHLIYPCKCTRKEIVEAQSAPHADNHELCYPGTCRPTDFGMVPEHEPDAAWRVIANTQTLTYIDTFAGEQSHNISEQVGDFVIATKTGLPAYQLAVVVDDARQGVTDIVRGDDLLRSAARQLWLYDCLELSLLPTYYHLPLVLGSDGRRLAKRHGDTRLSFYRDLGTSAEKIIGLIAKWSGIETTDNLMSANEFKDRFDLSKLSHDPVTFTDEDDQWLQEK